MKIAHESAPPEFPIGEDLESQILLAREDVLDVPVLDPSKFFRINVWVFPGVEYFLRAEEATNVIRAIFEVHLSRISFNRGMSFGALAAGRAFKYA
jgi:hypothetical protein